MLPFKVNLLKKKKKNKKGGEVAFLSIVFFPSSSGVLDMPVIMAIPGKWDLCLLFFVILLELLSLMFELHLLRGGYKDTERAAASLL